MIFLIKYLVIYPIVYTIGILDFIIDTFNTRKNLKFKNLPQKEPYSVQVDSSDPTSPFRSVLSKELLKITESETSLYTEFAESAEKYKNVESFGVRELLGVEEQAQENGKVFKKFNLANEYTWSTYQDVLGRVDDFSNGLLKLGLKSNDKIVLYSETRAEWLISAMACFKIKATVVTLYATLGVDALAFGVNETDASFVIASGESVLKVQKVFENIPKLKNVIVLTDKNENTLRNSMKNIQVHTIGEVEDIGRSSHSIETYEKPKKDDLAIIMYTSGSTGNPKGVMITHANLLCSVRAVSIRLGDFTREDLYIAYLPLAHVLELCVELAFIMGGVRVGYGNPLTLTDASTGVKEGQIGDLRVLKPTLMAGVPTVLERLSKAVKDKLAKESDFKRTLIETAAEFKLNRIKSGNLTLLMDKIIFNKINKSVFGGNLRIMVSGGALLNKDVQEFSQTYFCTIAQAYGLTETCGGATVQFGFECNTEQVGSVIHCSEIKLVDWPEGNYRCTDKPNPRGEVWIGGDHVTLGYYKMPEKTNEDYHVINGIRYFSTGDIGEMLPNGNLKIVDRKKDLVKLQSGEYVSLSKLEAVIKIMPFVDNCCVIANSYKTYCICIITPNVKKIEEYLGTGSNGSNALHEFLEMLKNNSKLQEKFNKDVVNHCLKQGLDRFEIPTKALFVKEIWLPDSGLVTDSLKLKRREIEKFYQKEIESIYH